MKKTFLLLLALMMLLSVMLVACGDEDQDTPPATETPGGDNGNNVSGSVTSDSVGLAFEEDDGGYIITGMGTCTDTDLCIPATYNNLPVIYIDDGAFEDCTGLTSVTIPDSVTSIGSYAFEGCSGLTSVTIPDSVTDIGFSAFYGCTNLIQIDNGVHYVDNWAVGCDSSVTTVTLRSNTRGIGGAFAYCTGLTSVTIPDSVTSIGSYAFEGCSGLTSVTIPNSVTTIGARVFSDCTGLTSVTIGNSVTTISAHAFSDCTGLTSITIPNSVTSIGDYAFSDCTELTSVTIGNGVTSIGHEAFEDCTGLTSVTIGNGVTSIGEMTFYRCSELTAVHITDLAAWCQIDFHDSSSNPLYYAKHLYLNGTEVKDLVIPDGVKTIGDLAFFGCSGLTSVVIPNSVTDIGFSAFSGCTGLTSVTIPNSVTTIGESAFRGCTGLTSITIPNSVTSIGYDAFEYCYKLIEVYNLSALSISAGSTDHGYVGYYAKNVYTDTTGESKLKTIDDYVFYVDGETRYLMGYIGNQTDLVLPDNCEGYSYEIYRYAFYKCTVLTSITIPNSVTSIGSYAFEGCTGLTSVTIGNGVTTIGARVFSDCTGLTSVTIGNSVTTISALAFSDCTELTSITIPNSVTTIGTGAFSDCTGLTAVHITDLAAWCQIDFHDSSSNPLRYAGHLYLNGTEVSLSGNFVIPEGIAKIGSYVFYGCENLTSVVIPNSVTTIGDSAFFGCSGLTAVHITDLAAWCQIDFGYYSANPLYYAKHLYLNGTEVKDLVIPDGVKTIGDLAFDSCYNLTSITIPNSVTTIGKSAFRGCTGLTSVTFADTSTWYRTTSSTNWNNKTGGTETDVSDPAANAIYFESTYGIYYWYKL